VLIYFNTGNAITVACLVDNHRSPGDSSGARRTVCHRKRKNDQSSMLCHIEGPGEKQQRQSSTHRIAKQPLGWSVYVTNALR